MDHGDDTVTIVATPPSDHPGIESNDWCVLVVRAWREGDALLVRVLRTWNGRDEVTAHRSPEEAADTVRLWLRDFMPDENTIDAEEDASTTPPNTGPS